MEEALEMARAKDTKERMAGVEHLHQYLETSSKCLSSPEVTSLVDVCLDLLKDNNFRVSQGALQSLASAAVLSGDHLKLHFNALVPAIVERLGDAKQPVRDAARRLLITLMEVSSPTIIVERAGSFAWMHKSWRVREEFARTVTSAISLFASTELPLQRAILPSILQMLSDSNQGVREAAISCIEEMYSRGGAQFHDELQRHHVPLPLLKDINARLQRIEPNNRSSEVSLLDFGNTDTKVGIANIKKSSPRSKSSPREVSIFGGEVDVTEKPVESVRVYSEKELTREIEKIIATLVPEKDWSIRISAMQRVEGLVCGGAAEYPYFRILVKQLVNPLTIQLSDRRSSIVKQACHLLSFLSKELLGDFEASIEMFVPVLFKLVVITVLVIAESADNCIKTMLRNCKVPRVLPRIADCAKNDRNAVLRARCCEYALLVLEYWADAPEIQKSADLYEDLIRCCVGDAISEVRSTARTCYRMFAKTWPERSRRLFSSFDPVIQRVMNDEDGGIHKRYASPSLRERGNQLLLPPPASVSSSLPGYGASAIVAMDKSSNLPSGMSITSGLLLSRGKSLVKGAERSLESVLHASKERVTAIESMLKGLDVSDNQNSAVRSSSLDLEVDPPSSRDPPLPLAAPASENLTGFASTLAKGVNHNGGILSDIAAQIQATKDAGKVSFSEQSSMSYSERVLKRQERGIEDSEFREARRFMNQHIARQYFDVHSRDSTFKDSQSSYIPNFQRPLLRKHASGRVPTGRKKSFEDSQFGEMSNYYDGPSSLNDALIEGLGPTSDWSVRVAAFNYIRSLLQQGPKGVQEVSLSFDKVMKLFFQHLDDPHHKVAQAALSTLADIILSCRKPFESYMERILPSVFSRLIDAKELVRQQCSTTLESLSRTYGIDSLLPALLRSLDEQRSPKAKHAVIEFAISSFTKHITNLEGSGSSGILKLWLAKLAPLVHDKNTKLKEAAINCIIAIYTHFDSTTVLNYILTLSVEEQNSLRRALKQYTPRIEVDLITFLQSKKERQRPKSSYDPTDLVGTSSDEGYTGLSKKSHLMNRFSAGSFESENSRKLVPVAESIKGSINNEACDDAKEHFYGDSGAISTAVLDLKNHNGLYGMSQASPTNPENFGSRIRSISEIRNSVDSDKLPSLCSDTTYKTSPNHHISSEAPGDLVFSRLKHQAVVVTSIETGPSIPQILHFICNEKDQNSNQNKHSSIQHLIDASIGKNQSVWSKYFNQILTVVLEVLDDPDSTVRELALSLISEMLQNQKDAMEENVEIVIEKLLHLTKDVIPKLSGEAEQCLTSVLSQYDAFRCLSVIVPLLINEDEKTLVTCINCLTKLVSRLSQEELMSQLTTFLPALFDAFGNQNADVRKTVVFCLVDIYIILGKAFLPYLEEGLNSTQLRLVTIYANRISQARTGTSIDGTRD